MSLSWTKIDLFLSSFQEELLIFAKAYVQVYSIFQIVVKM